MVAIQQRGKNSDKRVDRLHIHRFYFSSPFFLTR
jgi:hypothetical protein